MKKKHQSDLKLLRSSIIKYKQPFTPVEMKDWMAGNLNCRLISGDRKIRGCREVKTVW